MNTVPFIIVRGRTVCVGVCYVCVFRGLCFELYASLFPCYVLCHCCLLLCVLLCVFLMGCCVVVSSLYVSSCLHWLCC